MALYRGRAPREPVFILDLERWVLETSEHLAAAVSTPVEDSTAVEEALAAANVKRVNVRGCTAPLLPLHRTRGVTRRQPRMAPRNVKGKVSIRDIGRYFISRKPSGFRGTRK
jgi:hypothetical protein